MDYVKIREGIKEDIPQVFELIKELADFEKLEHEVQNTIEGLLQDGFGTNPVFGFLVAETKSSIVGLALYYFRYSTWKRKRLYLEDIIVNEPHRGKGTGKMLFEATLQKAKQLDCSGLNLQVLDWNKPAIKFYESYGLTLDSSWVNASLDFEKELRAKV